MYDVVIVGCGGRKQPFATTAKDLYTSTLFRKSRAWAERNGDQWFIASAKYGLLDPEQTTEPYDVRLGAGRGAPPIHDWARTLVADLLPHLPTDHVRRVAILAGQVYAEPIRLYLRPHAIVFEPLQGLGIGSRLAWLTREVAA